MHGPVLMVRTPRCHWRSVDVSDALWNPDVVQPKRGVALSTRDGYDLPSQDASTASYGSCRTLSMYRSAHVLCVPGGDQDDVDLTSNCLGDSRPPPPKLLNAGSVNVLSR